MIKTYEISSNNTIVGTFDVTDGQDGEDGENGVGFESVTYNESTNTLTVVLTDGTSLETGSLKGAKGDQGDSIDTVDLSGTNGLIKTYEITSNNQVIGTFNVTDGADGTDADLDAPTIKSRYESNANTNAFTDAERTKLANLETILGAKADLLGGVIPNSQIPSIAITEFLGEVADESEMLLLVGEKGDWVIRVDTGSMWILTSNTPSSLDNWLDVPTPPSGVVSVNGYQGIVVLTYSDVGAASAAQGTKADTALQSGDIGVSVQSYNANTVIDASYLRTDNNYTNTEKTKLAGIEAGAQVNVRSDWNATSGDAQILNKPTLGTAAATDTSSYATAAQGAKADTALQPRQKMLCLLIQL